MLTTAATLAALLGPAVVWPHGGATTVARVEVEQQAFDAEKLAKVQAAFVLNFVKFTTWPRSAFASDDAPLVVAVVCDDADAWVATVFAATLNDRKLGGHAICVRRVTVVAGERGEQRDARLRELSAAHVAFLSDGDPLTRAEVRAVGASAVLTVAAPSADAGVDARRGAIFSFGVEQGKVVFYYDAEAARSSTLALSSKLLALARTTQK